MSEHLYRYEDHVYASIDEDVPVGNIPTVSGKKFKVLKVTPCGFWISYAFSKKWVSNSSKKRFAYPTVDEAWRSFRARKARQMVIYRNRLERATCAYNAIQPPIP